MPELDRAGREMRRWRTTSIVLAALLGCATLTAAAAVAVAIRASNETNTESATAGSPALADERELAASRASAAAAMASVDSAPDLAMLLALEAYDLVDDQASPRSYEARNSLLTALQRHSRLEAVLRVRDRARAAITFSPDGSLLAVASEDGPIELWELASRSRIGEPMRPAYSCSIGLDVRFTADGDSLTQVNGCEATVFDVDTGKPRRRLSLPADENQEEEAVGVLSPDGETVAVSGEYNGFKLVDMRTGKRLAAGFGSAYRELYPGTFSTDGRLLAGAEDGYGLWDVGTGARLGVQPPGTVLALTPSRAAVMRSGRVWLWDIATSSVVGKPLAEGPILQAQFDDAGDRLAISTDDGLVGVWRVPAHGRARRIASLQHAGVEALRFAPDGRTLATSGVDGTVSVWNVAAALPLARRLDGTRAWNVAYDPSGDALAANSGRGVLLWDISDGAVVRPPRQIDPDDGTSIAFSHDGATLVVGDDFVPEDAAGPTHGECCSAGTVRYWDVESGSPLHAGPLQADEWVVSDVTFTGDGDVLVTGGGDVRFFDDDRTPIGKPIRGGDDWSFQAIAVSRDGSTLAGVADEGAGSGSLGFWNIEARTRLGKSIPTDASAVAFHPGRQLVATGHDDGMLRLWSVADRSLAQQLSAHALTTGRGCCSRVNSVRFSADGSTLVTTGRDGTVRLWEVSRLQPLGEPLRLPGQAHEVADARLSPDTNVLVAATEIGVLVWDSVLTSADLERWRTRLCAIVSRNLTTAEWTRFLPDRPYRKTCPQFG